MKHMHIRYIQKNVGVFWYTLVILVQRFPVFDQFTFKDSNIYPLGRFIRTSTGNHVYPWCTRRSCSCSFHPIRDRFLEIHHWKIPHENLHFLPGCSFATLDSGRAIHGNVGVTDHPKRITRLAVSIASTVASKFYTRTLLWQWKGHITFGTVSMDRFQEKTYQTRRFCKCAFKPVPVSFIHKHVKPLKAKT